MLSFNEVVKTALEAGKAVNEVSSLTTEIRSEYPDLFKKSGNVEGLKNIEAQSATRVEYPSMFEKNEVRGLTDVEKDKIKAETGWSDNTVEHIRSMEEYKIYKDADLQEAEIGGKKALIRSDIDWGQIDEKGRTNAQRIEKGLSPLDRYGNSIELHHIGQKADSPLAELTDKEHRCDGNDNVLHDKNKTTEVHGEGNNWNNERQNYWHARAEYNKEVTLNV